MPKRRILESLHSVKGHTFAKPVKRIFDGPDVAFFLTSLAYRDIMTFILQLNRSVVPLKTQDGESTRTQTWQTDSSVINRSSSVRQIQSLIHKLDSIIDEVPPDPGPRRFGNVSFRKWSQTIEQRISELLIEYLPSELEPAFVELESYLLGSFGSPQRLDYGTGHELSFLAFLACLWKLDYFDTSSGDMNEERAIVVGIFEPYLQLIRKLNKTYTLEPAGSHGVWGLDDNSFLPYIFGSAQFCPPTSESEDTPTEGSLFEAPAPSTVAKSNLVEKEKDHNMYFSAIAFIYDIKKGPFWEHSPMLFDISGIKDGWGKINKGMIKMYNAEVLSKFPVVQHFPFGSLLKWEKDPEAKQAPPVSVHQSSQPLRDPMGVSAQRPGRSGEVPGTGVGTAAPWAMGAATARPLPPVGFVNGVTQAPWASRTPTLPPGRVLQRPVKPPGPPIAETPNQPQG